MTADEVAAEGEGLDINGLAAASGYTVRNIRAYLQMGLLAGGRKVGRKLFFSAEHLERLEWIAECRQRGYSLPAIKDIIAGTVLVTEGETDGGDDSAVIDLTAAGAEATGP